MVRKGINTGKRLKHRTPVSKHHSNLVLGVRLHERTDKCFWAIDHEIFLETYSFIAKEGEFSRFVKEVYEVDFVDFSDLELDNIEKVLSFIKNAGFNNIRSEQAPSIIKERGFIVIETLEGNEKLFPGEVLIKGIRGELYPVKKENFDLVYEIIK